MRFIEGDRLDDEAITSMTYVEAFLFLTVDKRLPFVAVLDWLQFLSVEYPASRLAIHVKLCKPVQSKELV